MISSENIKKIDSPVSDVAIATSYSQEAVQEILHLAIARQHQGGELSRVQMQEIADDLGISPDSLQAAEKEWLSHQGEFQQRKEFNAFRISRLQQHLVKYGIVNAFLILLNLVSGYGLSWALYIFLGWGMLLALQAWKTYQIEGEDYENAFKQWRVKQQLGQSINTFVSKWIKPY